MSVFRDYIRVYCDGEDYLEPMPGTVRLIGISLTKQYTNKITFDSRGETYLYVSYYGYAKLNGLEYYFLKGPVAYTKNVLRIQILIWDKRIINALLEALHMDNAREHILDTNVDRFRCEDSIQKMQKRLILSDKQRLNGAINRKIKFSSFVSFKTESKNGKVRMLQISAQGICLKIFNNEFVCKLNGIKFVVVDEYLVCQNMPVYWLPTYAARSVLARCEVWSVHERVTPTHDNILAKIIQMIEKKTPNPLRALPIPISQKILKYWRPIKIKAGQFV